MLLDVVALVKEQYDTHNESNINCRITKIYRKTEFNQYKIAVFHK